MLRSLGVIGATEIGRELVLSAVQAGLHVTFIDKSADSLYYAKKAIRKRLEKTAEDGFVFVDDLPTETSYVNQRSKLIKTTTNLQETKATDLTIEVTHDHLKTKQEIAHELDKICHTNTILATQTESLRISDIARKVDKKCRFVGIHFVRPIQTSYLAETVFLTGATERTRIIVSEFCKLLNKTEFQCEDTPGFVINRLLASLAAEAKRITKGRCIPEEKLERALKGATGIHIGPFEFYREIGQDGMERIMNIKH